MSDDRAVYGVMTAVALALYEQTRAAVERIEPLLAQDSTARAALPWMLRAQADEMQAYELFVEAARAYAGKDEADW